MAPRVRQVGESLDSLDYEDEHGNKFSVPRQAVRTPLPEQYTQELVQGFEAFKHAPPEVQESERQRYNRLAVNTRQDNPAGATDGLDHDLRGLTRTRLPNARQFGDLSSERLLGPTPAGPSLSDRPSVGISQMVRSGDTEALEHEGLHASAADPTGGSLQKRYTDMGPREREQWRVFSALHNEADPHRPHDTQPPPQYEVEIGPATVAKQQYEVEVGPSYVQQNNRGGVVPLISQDLKDNAAMLPQPSDKEFSERREAQRTASLDQAVNAFRAKLGLL